MDKDKENKLPEKNKISYKKILKQIKNNKPNLNNLIKVSTLSDGELISKHSKI